MSKIRQIALAKKLKGEMSPGEYLLRLPAHESENIGRFGGRDMDEMIRLHQQNYSPGTVLRDLPASPREEGSFAIDYGTGTTPQWQNPAFPPPRLVK